MAEVVRYVDPDATGAGDGTSWTDAYTSLNAWNAAEATDLVTATDWHHVYVRASSGTADSTACTISNVAWTTGAGNYILIEAADGDEAVKTGIDTSRYRFTNALTFYVGHLRIKGLQFTRADSNIFISAPGDATQDSLIDSCYFESTSGSGAIVINDTNRVLTVQNCIIDASGANDGINFNGTTLNVYQTVVYGATYDGVEFDGGDGEVINCAVFNVTGTDFDIVVGSTVTIDHCASDDGTGTNAVSPSGSDWANEFVDAANGDFTLVAGGNLENGGTTITGGPSTDMDGDSWDATPSIGVDEIASGGGGTPQELAGTLSAISALSGAIEITRTLAGSLAGQSTASAALQVSRALAGQAAAQSGITAALQVTRELSGALSGQSEAVGAIEVARTLAGVLAAASELSGDLSTTKLIDLAGTLEGSGTMSGDLLVERALAGTLSGTAEATAAIEVIRELAGVLAGQSGASGSLQVGALDAYNELYALAVEWGGEIELAATWSTDLELAATWEAQ